MYSLYISYGGLVSTTEPSQPLLSPGVYTEYCCMLCMPPVPLPLPHCPVSPSNPRSHPSTLDLTSVGGGAVSANTCTYCIVHCALPCYVHFEASVVCCSLTNVMSFSLSLFSFTHTPPFLLLFSHSSCMLPLLVIISSNWNDFFLCTWRWLFWFVV